MGVIGLNLPTEIKWERICVSHDMMDRTIFEIDDPPKWNSSIALFKYVPEEEYQVYYGRKITYLKVTCTLSGFQEKKDEIEGRINWHGVNHMIWPTLEESLETYFPCTGAIVQVSVSPSDESEKDLDNYPYIMDIQPKKRELFETASDTNEVASRTLDGLAVKKAIGSTGSKEVVDTDEQESGHGTYDPHRTSKVTKSLTGEPPSSTETTSDASRERRETLSHTTQISQLYHLLDSYHVGTNRVVFFIQPRAHTLEEPSGFVRGPRPIEGIQEFFIIVNQPKDQGDFCVAVRLDTGHLYDYLTFGEGDSMIPTFLRAVLVTARGLRCCPKRYEEEPLPTNGVVEDYESEHFDQGIVGSWEIPHDDILESPKNLITNPNKLSAEQEQREIERIIILRRQGMMTTKEVNYLGNAIRHTMFRSLTSRRRVAPGRISLLDLSLVPKTLMRRLSQTNEGRHLLGMPLAGNIDSRNEKILSDWFKKDAQDITRREVLEISNPDLGRILNMDEPAANKLKLALLGVPLHEDRIRQQK